MFINAKKLNENFPKPHMDQGINLDISWTLQPMIEMIMGMLEKQPEDPMSDGPGPGMKNEPCGKQPFQLSVQLYPKLQKISLHPSPQNHQISIRLLS